MVPPKLEPNEEYLELELEVTGEEAKEVVYRLEEAAGT